MVRYSLATDQSSAIKKGCVYVISTPIYSKKNIYKIGFTDSIKRRLSQFNNTRIPEDKYSIFLQYDTVQYKKLETELHKAFVTHRLNNELFRMPLSEIKKTADHIINEGFFGHYDVLFDKAYEHKLSLHDKVWSMSLTTPSNNSKTCTVTLFLNDARLIEHIKSWLSVYDKHGLYKFISEDYYISLVSFLKTVCSSYSKPMKFATASQNINYSVDVITNQLKQLSTTSSDENPGLSDSDGSKTVQELHGLETRRKLRARRNFNVASTQKKEENNCVGLFGNLPILEAKTETDQLKDISSDFSRLSLNND